MVVFAWSCKGKNYMLVLVLKVFFLILIFLLKLVNLRKINLICSNKKDDIIMIKEALELHIESMLEDGQEPMPIDESKCTGKLNIRTSKSTHLKLLKLAEDENVSVSHLINDAIKKTYG